MNKLMNKLLIFATFADKLEKISEFKALVFIFSILFLDSLTSKSLLIEVKKHPDIW